MTKRSPDLSTLELYGSSILPPPPDGPSPVDTPWFRGPNDYCKVCGPDAPKRALTTCGICELPICGSHRWGTGSLGDGYYCIKHEEHELPSRWEACKFMAKADPWLAAVLLLGVTSVLLVLALAIVQITLAVLGLPNWPRHK